MADKNGVDLAENLHQLERKVLPHISDGISVKELVDKSGLKEVEVMRALQWMGNKKILKMSSSEKILIILDENGSEYVKKGLPERRFLRALKQGEVSFKGMQKKAGLGKDELNVCIGVLKKKAAIAVDKGNIKMLEHGENILSKKSLEEVFIEKLSKKSIELKSLQAEEKFAYENLKKRKGIIKEDSEKTITVRLSSLGKKVKYNASKSKESKVIDRLTPEMLKNLSWKNKKFRKYDIKINVPRIDGGKRHFVKQAVSSAKKIWLEMGFKEMVGPMLNTSFWNFDALFTAQDHPARELQDTFYIKNPASGRLPGKNLVAKVKKSHENGVGGSIGWRYNWKEEDAKKNVMRTHTTVLSARTIAAIKKSDLPAKFFAVGKCFRNETLDWSHLFEFNQTEGIVVDPDANFRHLLGYLKEFFSKMGFPKARFRPAFFPYTEPSVEIDVYHPVHKQWIELGGAGIFRPEVVIPLLGEDIPVLAWGPGFDRIIMDYYNISDIRDLYKNDMKQLREMKAWMR